MDKHHYQELRGLIGAYRVDFGVFGFRNLDLRFGKLILDAVPGL